MLQPSCAERTTLTLLSRPCFFFSELSLLPSCPWAPATNSPTITTVLATVAGKPCRPRLSCLHRRCWWQASPQRGEDASVPLLRPPPILLVLFKFPSLSSISCGRKCPTGGFSSEEQINPHPAWGGFPAKQRKLHGAFKGFGRNPGIVVFVILCPS